MGTRNKIKRFLPLDTIENRYSVNSGVVVSNGYAELITASETSISSVAMQNSGDGFYWSHITLPGNEGYYVVHQNGTVNTESFPRKERIKIADLEVDNG